jgi:O-antigen ligase
MKDQLIRLRSKILTFNNGSLAFIALLLCLPPLARGGVQLWCITLITGGVILAGGLVLLEKFVSGLPPRRPTPLDLPLAALAAVVLLATAWAPYKPDAIEGAILFFSYVGLFFIVIHTVHTREQQLFIVYFIVTMAVVLSLIGLLKRFDLLPVDLWNYPIHRKSISVAGTYGNRNHLAGYLEMAIPLMFGLFLIRHRTLSGVLLLSYLALFLIVTHILTLSRGGWISLTFALLFFVITLLSQQRFANKKLLIGIVFATISVFFIILSSTDAVQRLLTLTEEDTYVDLSGRSHAWTGVLAMIAHHPLFGTGPGSFATFFTQFQPAGLNTRFYYAHNDYLQILAEVGGAVIVPFFWLLYGFCREVCKKLRHRSRQTWGITLGASTGVVALLVHSFSDFNLYIPANAILFTVLVALAVGGPNNANKPRHKSRLTR